jgi:hypothetical protein
MVEGGRRGRMAGAAGSEGGGRRGRIVEGGGLRRGRGG